ncbi:hypothetical protein CMV_022558 [Castanea mollissima]|uniref:Pyrroline-5-carboxylate reductase n=1 Tax=Castanea mollissima TaxID=60419 RepID=A0A8J4QUR4_9ROSI|nr:hypothetical protein CMV_022558 [Castanea mollissima]
MLIILVQYGCCKCWTIDHAQPGPIDQSVLTLQANHQSEAIWNGQYWAWARFPYLCPTVEHGPPVDAYGPPVRGPLSLKWLWVPNKKNRPAHIFLDRYREQIASMLPGQVVWQPYEAEFEDLPPWCVAGRAVWMATVPLVCFHLVEKHTPDRVVRQFGMIQEIPRNVDTDTVLHAIDLRGKVSVDWMRKHAAHITEWGNRLQQRCEAVLGDMPPQHEYFDWYKRVTRRFINVLGARLIIMIEGYARLLRRHPVGTEDHRDITDVLNAVQEIGRVQAPIPEAPNEEAATPAATPTQSPSTSRALVGRGSRSSVATPRVVPTPDPHPSTPNPSPSPTIPSPIPHPSPSPTIPSPIPHPSPSPTIPSPIPHPSSSPTTIPSPTPHPCPGSDIRPPTPRSFPELSPIPSFDLGLDLTPPDMHPQPPSHSTSTGPSSGIDPPHVHIEQPVGLPAEAGGRPKRIAKAPPCGTKGHKHGHNAGPEASDEGHARPPPHYTRWHKVQKSSLILLHSIVMSLGGSAIEEDADIIAKLFGSVGKIWRGDEKFFDAVTGLSGSGPAYIYLAIEALANGGVAAGLPRELGLGLASQTVLGAASIATKTGKHPGQLKDEVTSPGGTTIAGIHELEKGGFRGTLMNAVIAAANRSRELSQN